LFYVQLLVTIIICENNARYVLYNVKLVKTIFHRCKIYLSFLNESSEKTHEMACFLYVRLPPVLNFGTHSVGAHACYIPHPILLHVFILRDPMFWSQAFKSYDEMKKVVTCGTFMHRPFPLYSNAEQGQFVQLASFRQLVCNHYITFIVSYWTWPV